MGENPSAEIEVDVVVVGAGVAGLAAAIVLAGAGRSVVCVDPVLPPRERVGESLDWGAPSLLRKLGLPHGHLVASGVATWKREVHGVASSGAKLVGRAEAWMGRWPLRFQLETIHVDRRCFDTSLYERASSVGVRFMKDAVTLVDVDGDRVIECATRAGRRLTARWFLDASGRARLFGRALGVDRCDDAPPRVALWAHRRARQVLDGTVLHLDDSQGELRWVWEIPVSPDTKSVGLVISDSEFRRQRAATTDPAALLDQLLAGFGDIGQLEQADTDPVHVRSYRSYTHQRVSGSNWMMIGEAAAFVDPLTSTGVSTALRHGVEAAEIILSGPPGGVSRALRRFDRRVRSVASLYNAAVEDLLYSPEARERVGIRKATQAYVIIGFGLSALYTRIGASGVVRHSAVVAVVGAFRFWLQSWLRIVHRRRSRLIHVDPSSIRAASNRPT